MNPYISFTRNIHKELGKILYELRISEGYTVKDLSKIIGISSPAINYKEAGTRNININDLLHYASFFGLFPSDLLSLAEKRSLLMNK